MTQFRSNQVRKLSSEPKTDYEGTLNLSNPFRVTEYNDYDLSTEGALTFNLSGDEIEGGTDKIRVISDGVTPFVSESVLNNFFTGGAYNIPENRILPSGTYPIYIQSMGSDGILINSVKTPQVSTGIGGDAPVLLSAVILNSDFSEVVMTFDRNVDISSEAGFTLGGTTSNSFSSITGTGTSVLIGSLATNATAIETIVLNYNATIGNVVASSDSTPLESFSGEDITVSDVTVPTVESLIAFEASVITLKANEDLALTLPQIADLDLEIDTGGGYSSATIINVVKNGADQIDITISETITATDDVRLSYTQSLGNEIQDTSGNLMADFSNQVVTLNLEDLPYFEDSIFYINSYYDTDVVRDGSNQVSEVRNRVDPANPIQNDFSQPMVYDPVGKFIDFSGTSDYREGLIGNNILYDKSLGLTVTFVLDNNTGTDYDTGINAATVVQPRIASLSNGRDAAFYGFGYDSVFNAINSGGASDRYLNKVVVSVSMDILGGSALLCMKSESTQTNAFTYNPTAGVAGTVAINGVYSQQSVLAIDVKNRTSTATELRELNNYFVNQLNELAGSEIIPPWVI